MAPVTAKQRAAAAIAAACVTCLPLTASFEGVVLHPHRDPLGYADVCYGDRSADRRTYTLAECQAILRQRQQKDYAEPLARCVPAFAQPPRRNAFAASIDASYNGGVAAFCRSPMAAAFNRNRWTQGCNAFPAWHTLPGSKVHNGLLRRRMAERALCLKAPQ